MISAQGQPQTCATNAKPFGGVAPLEALEEMLQFFGQDAKPVVLDGEDDLRVFPPECELDLSVFRREFDGVRQQVQDDLPLALFVGIDRRRWREIELHIVPAILGNLSGHRSSQSIRITVSAGDEGFGELT